MDHAPETSTLSVQELLLLPLGRVEVYTRHFSELVGLIPLATEIKASYVETQGTLLSCLEEIRKKEKDRKVKDQLLALQDVGQHHRNHMKWLPSSSLILRIFFDSFRIQRHSS